MFEAQIDSAITTAEVWTTREPLRAEAWFYLGGAYGARSQWRVLRGSRLAAARDGKRIKDSLERALSLDPGMADAHFGIGLYRYYADVAPAAVKILQWLFLLPGGDRAGGLEQVQAVGTHQQRGCSGSDATTEDVQDGDGDAKGQAAAMDRTGCDV